MTTLEMVTDLRANSLEGSWLERWASDVATKSGGALTIEVTHAFDTLGNTQALDDVISGQIDFAFLSPASNSRFDGRFEGLSLGLSPKAGADNSELLYDVLTRSETQEYWNSFGIDVLAAAFEYPEMIIANDIGLFGPTQLEGLKVAAHDIAADWVSAQDAASINMFDEEINTALFTGIIDAAIVSSELVVRTQLDEVTDTQLGFSASTGLATPFKTLLVNKNVFDGLSSELQTILNDTTGKLLSGALGAEYEIANAGFLNLIDTRSDGYRMTTLGERFIWSTTIEPFEDANFADTPAGALRETFVSEQRDLFQTIQGIDDPTGDEFAIGPFAVITRGLPDFTSIRELDGGKFAVLEDSVQVTALATMVQNFGISHEVLLAFDYIFAAEQLAAGAVDAMLVPMSLVNPAALRIANNGLIALPEGLAEDGTLVDFPDANTGTDANGSPSIIGTVLSENLDGTSASEILSGLGGTDWITPGAGSDTIDGGIDRDMLSFVTLQDTPGRTNTQYRLDLDLGEGRATTSGDDVYQISNIERVTGTIFADRIKGDENDNELRGLGDYDWFTATTGDDTINGGTGQDMISYVDWLNDADNTADPFNPGGAPPPNSEVTGVVVDLNDTSNNTNLAAGHTYIDVERVTGSGRQDVFYGDDRENDFRGLGDYDWFVSSTGGRERYFGGDGVDTVTYYNASAGVTAGLSNGATVAGEETGRGVGGDAALDLFFSIEGLVGTNFDDTLSGSSGRNNLSGLDGDDFLYGYAGIDQLKGGKGNDHLDGGAGSDYALYDGNQADFTLTKTASNMLTISGINGTDTLVDVEYFRFADGDVTIWELTI